MLFQKATKVLLVKPWVKLEKQPFTVRKRRDDSNKIVY